MDRALALARAAAEDGEIPVGAVVAGPDGTIVGEAHNLTRTLKDPTAHAEMLAIRQAAQAFGAERLTGCDLYVSSNLSNVRGRDLLLRASAGSMGHRIRRAVA